MRPSCGCCSTGAQYVARHVDPRGILCQGVDTVYLAREYCAQFAHGWEPMHLPDAITLSVWIREYLNHRRSGLQPAA